MDYINDKNAFKPIRENPIILDFSGVQYLGEMHFLLKEKMVCLSIAVISGMRFEITLMV